MQARVRSSEQPTTEQSRILKLSWLWDVLLIVILLVGAYFRLIGLDWDQSQHLHPDERFLTMVETSLQPPPTIGDYFNTATSTLNPHNIGYTFFVYGTLPIYIVYYVGKWIGQLGYGQIYLVGRFLSALFDLGTVFLTYLIAARLYKRNWLALLAAAFAALSVLSIQLSHFFAVDTFLNFFIYLAIYFAVQIITRPMPPTEQRQMMYSVGGPGETVENEAEGVSAPSLSSLLLGSWKGFAPYALFGFALGCSMASKVSAAPLAVLLPIAAYIWWTRLPEEQRIDQAVIILRNLALAAILSFLTFRIFQPYAFSGPGFFGLKLNDLWLANLKELQGFSNGDVDFPPALQWARRPITFALQNMVLWGLGLPLGLLSWAGFLWIAWRMLRGEWKQHLVLWIWVAFNFAWQSVNFTRSMRYQLPVYPGLAIMAAWAVVTLWENGSIRRAGSAIRKFNWQKVLAGVLGVSVLVGTLLWAYAFTRIYTRLHTRVAASQWIYQNVPGPVNLEIQTRDGVVQQPMGIEHSYDLITGNPFRVSYTPSDTGTVSEIQLDHVDDPPGDADIAPLFDSDIETLQVRLLVGDGSTGEDLGSGSLSCPFVSGSEAPCAAPYVIALNAPVQVQAGQKISIEFSILEPNQTLRLTYGGEVHLVTPSGEVKTDRLPDFVRTVKPGVDFYLDPFTPKREGTLGTIHINRAVDWLNTGQEKTLQFSLLELPDMINPVAVATLTSTFAPGDDPRGQAYDVQFNPAPKLDPFKSYVILVQIQNGPGQIAFYGTAAALETDWDDPLPVPLENFSPYPNMYRGELNFQMYWDDDAAKLERFEKTLDQADYLFLSSNRQWGTTVRVPERYPLTTAYYRNLLGCPDDKSVFWCYAVARPGMFQGKLGYELVYVSESFPNIGPIRFNDQFAEEAFSVYDHPKAMVFKKTANYNPQAVRQILGAVDLSQVIHLSPKQASDFKGNLMLPADRLARQEAGGTWSALFNRQSLSNQIPLVVWYLVILLLGWSVYPFVRLAMGGLADRGYPFARFAGMMLLALFSWLAGSFGIAYSRLTITIVFIGLVLVNAGLAFWKLDELKAEIRKHWKLILFIEGLALATFVFFLLIRLGNPDLWHPYKGGEKPMDFSFLNAVIKSTTFPPYDPWFAGGYINYYYYGFVIVGTLVKWLGIIPSVAYNLILPTLFSAVALSAFSIGWNLYQANKPEEDRRLLGRKAILAGLASVLALLILGNLGTVRMLWNGMQMLASNGVPLDQAGFFERLLWTFQGFGKFISGQKLPYAPGTWYWDPSRAIATGAGNEITEFPFFTFLYADLHAHMMALPVTLLSLGVALSFLLCRFQCGFVRNLDRWVRMGAALFLGAVAIGALRATNTWDMPVYLALTVSAILYTSIRYAQPIEMLEWLPIWIRKAAAGAAVSVVLVGLAILLYQPFSTWYGQGYNSVELWKGPWSPVSDYLVHWGLFLFVITSWLVAEAIDWMAHTPLSRLNRLRPFLGYLQVGLVLFVAVLGVLLIRGIAIAWISLPLALLAGILLFRPGQSDAKRAVLFMIGTGLVLTLMVEIVVLKGDIGRMNTIFKFYLQAWSLLSISAAVSLVWLWPKLRERWNSGWYSAWQLGLILLIFGATLFPLIAGRDKVTDRMSASAPHTLDGMAFMLTSTYADFDTEMDLSQDYRAIRWMQDNVQGSPVIVEGNAPLYHWGSRYTIYTGLPGVVGWDWHEIQQRAIVPSDWIRQRIDAVHNFYLTTDTQEAEQFLQKYNVKYIVVGQMERAEYRGLGLDKFVALNGDLWKEVYRDGDTVIYEVQ